MKSKNPSNELLAKTLGAAKDVWEAVIAALSAEYGPLKLEWKVSKSAFGWMALLKQKKRTVVYLTPEESAVRVAIVFGERAASRALDSNLPEFIKALIREAKPYAEGRGIRFSVRSVIDLPAVTDLIAIKMT